jgi:hypothetical protein
MHAFVTKPGDVPPHPRPGDAATKAAPQEALRLALASLDESLSLLTQ